jgi:hypothetical protein
VPESAEFDASGFPTIGFGDGMPAECYSGWAGGFIKPTWPICGDRLASPTHADTYCRKIAGEGFRMAEFHDGKYVVGTGGEDYSYATWPEPEKLLSGGWNWHAWGVRRRRHAFLSPHRRSAGQLLELIGIP